MAFEEQLPQWENEGTQPPQSKRVEGWLPNEKPPASWFNWLFHRTYKALQELQEKAGERVDVEQAQQTADNAATAAANAQGDIDAHLADNTNPHNVTSSQVNLLAPNIFKYNDPASVYPNGVSTFLVSLSGEGGWPTNGEQGMVITFRASPDRNSQFITDNAYGGSKILFRKFREAYGWFGEVELLHTGNTTNIVNQEYEKGGWTPELRFGGSTSGISYTFRAGQYTRIANVVYWSFSIVLNSKGSASGSAVIAGLPFVREPVLGYDHCIGSASNIAVPSGRWLVSRISSTASIYLYTNDGASSTTLTNAEFADNSSLQASGFYFI